MRHNTEKTILELFISSLTDTYFLTLKPTQYISFAQQFTHRILHLKGSSLKKKKTFTDTNILEYNVFYRSNIVPLI